MLMLFCIAMTLLISCAAAGEGELPPVSQEQQVGQESPQEPQSPPAEIITDYPVTLDGLKTALNELRSAEGAAVSESDILLNQREQNDYYSTDDFIAAYESKNLSEDEITDDEFYRLTHKPSGSSGGTVSAAQAVEDADCLFRLLRTSYGAYELFGGDAVFDAAQLALNDEIMRDYPNGLADSELASLIVKQLDFIEDSHFSVGGMETGFEEKYYFRDVLNPVFYRDSRGFYTVWYGDEQNTRWYLRQEDEKYIRLTIASDGELVYGLFALAGEHSAGELPEKLMLSDGETEQAYNPHWIMMSCSSEQKNGYYTYTEKEDIPIVALNSFYIDKYSFDDINRYLNDTKRLRGEEVIIVDLRYNTGGHDSLSAMWIYSLTDGTAVPWSVDYASYISRMNEYIITSNSEAVDDLYSQLDFHKDYPDYLSRLEEATTYSLDDAYIVKHDSGFAEYDGTIFVLFNKETYSAGELALFQFENLSNVVFVGVNSNGCLLTGGTNAAAPVYLPNSGLQIKYSMMVITGVAEDFDSAGYQPDIVVDNATAVDDIIKCWQYYGQE